MTITLLQGDCRDILPTLPEQSVQCVITSPPYWGLRNYGVAGQLGLEQTPDEYIQNMVNVFRDVRRVLRDDGTCWINLGDSYAMDSKWGGTSGAKNYTSAAGGIPRERHTTGLGDKQLIGIPWRVAFALQDDGWILRSDIIWHKPNCMPESVTDRPTRSHEYLFLFAKQPRYYYDAAAIAEPLAESSVARINQATFDEQTGGPKDYRNGTNANRSARAAVEHFKASGAATRNRRTVWTVATRPYKGAHFATFPEALVEPCVLAGSAAQACEVCGAAWGRISEPTGHINKREPAHVPGNTATKVDSTGWAPTICATDTFRPRCACENGGAARSVVLDPFAGSGTTLRVAERLGRDSIGIELNGDYLKLQEKRTDGIQRIMTEVL